MPLNVKSIKSIYKQIDDLKQTLLSQNKQHEIEINELNKARPQTSYGGMNQRRKKLQIALNSAKYRHNDNNKESNDKDIC